MKNIDMNINKHIKSVADYLGRKFQRNGNELEKEEEKKVDINPNDAKFYYLRGLLLIQDNQKDSGCLDLSKASELGYKYAYEAIKKFCQ